MQQSLGFAVVDDDGRATAVWLVSHFWPDHDAALTNAVVFAAGEDRRAADMCHGRWVVATARTPGASVQGCARADLGTFISETGRVCAALQAVYAEKASKNKNLKEPRWPAIPTLAEDGPLGSQPTLAGTPELVLAAARLVQESVHAWINLEQERVTRRYLHRHGGDHARMWPPEWAHSVPVCSVIEPHRVES